MIFEDAIFHSLHLIVAFQSIVLRDSANTIQTTDSFVF